MNSWPGPENSWEGVDAYFTWANSPWNAFIYFTTCWRNFSWHYLVSCKT